jgi:hypothetical protein
MEFTRKDTAFQGYSVPKDRLPSPVAIRQAEAWAKRAFKDQEFHAKSEFFTEVSYLSGEDNDFLEIYPMKVVSYLAVS